MAKKLVSNGCSLLKYYAIGVDAYAILLNKSTIGGVNKHVARACITKSVGIGTYKELLSCRIDVDANRIAW